MLHIVKCREKHVFVFSQYLENQENPTINEFRIRSITGTQNTITLQREADNTQSTSIAGTHKNS